MTPSPATTHLDITVNGTPHRIPSACSIGGLLGILGMERRRVAVARNRDVVPRSNFDSESVSSGDRIEILEAVGGG